LHSKVRTALEVVVVPARSIHLVFVHSLARNQAVVARKGGARVVSPPLDLIIQSLARAALDNEQRVRVAAVSGDARARLLVDAANAGEPRVAFKAVLSIAAATQQRVTETTWRLLEQGAAVGAQVRACIAHTESAIGWNAPMDAPTPTRRKESTARPRIIAPWCLNKFVIGTRE